MSIPLVSSFRSAFVRTLLVGLLPLCSAAQAGPARADIVIERPSIALAAARSIVAAANAEAGRNGWAISVAVVDIAGELVAFEKSDAAIGISPAVAIGKARTAALLQAPSKQFEDFINAGRPSFLSTPGVTALEGGVPIVVEGRVVGAVGVSGAHGANDSQVATVAAAAIEHPRK
ncbi:heme-binding protein [Xanthomonas arboricola]|uniref:Heme-binding protein n=1 Tax=Xanthomonas arboricola TaxID=56448 RepID=A0A2S6YXA2_9XANT|nr:MULTISPECIES: heme-binding protein [Pseudomonadota]CAG2083959.1 heme-binding protein [Xanthomonas arboricola pv. juglandis]MBB3850109.1 glc operon protein GlcG [Xanthomonas arboricola]PPT24201.1 heme-binding protein [Xanthomonas arboricola]PPT40013.1 heme-binding protein [Xanthomonas arboricola]PPT51257.1 heme-binding protein [Xanthomonas arboricola]